MYSCSKSSKMPCGFPEIDLPQSACDIHSVVDERDMLHQLLRDIRNTGLAVYHTGDTDSQRDVKRRIMKVTQV